MPTLKELVATYNAAAATLGERPVTKFPDRATAERRVAALLARLQPARGPFSRTPARAPLAKLSPPREGTQRAQCIALMLRPRGATHAELEAVVRAFSAEGNVAQRIRDIIGLAHKAHGYGVRPSADGQTVRVFVLALKYFANERS